jgi:hypothetical protein
MLVIITLLFAAAGLFFIFLHFHLFAILIAKNLGIMSVVPYYGPARTRLLADNTAPGK